MHGNDTSEIIYLPICLKIIKDGDESQWMNYVFLKKKLLIISMLIELIGFLVGNYDDLIYF